jgi:hypothetical protein
MHREAFRGVCCAADPTVVWLLDGVNSGGISGGPLITQEESGSYCVFAVVCCYVPTELNLFGVSYLLASDDAPGPRAFVKANSGLMIGYDIRHATATMDQWLGSRPPE